MTPDFANTQLQTAQIVADCWREVLELSVVDPLRNFFELGGTSVHAIVLHAKLHERLPACEFSVMTIFEHPTIAEFVEAIRPSPGTAPATAMLRDRAPVTRPAQSGLSAQQRAERQQQRIAGQAVWTAARR